MGYYEIILESHIDKKREKNFEGMELKYLPGGKTLMTGILKDQAQLFSVLNRIRDMNITLLSIKKDDNDMEVINEKLY